jgi:hypothetical protein
MVKRSAILRCGKGRVWHEHEMLTGTTMRPHHAPPVMTRPTHCGRTDQKRGMVLSDRLPRTGEQTAHGYINRPADRRRRRRGLPLGSGALAPGERREPVAGFDRMRIAVVLNVRGRNRVVVPRRDSCTNSPTAIEARTPFGHTTCGRPPVAAGARIKAALAGKA